MLESAKKKGRKSNNVKLEKIMSVESLQLNERSDRSDDDPIILILPLSLKELLENIYNMDNKIMEILQEETTCLTYNNFDYPNNNFNKNGNIKKDETSNVIIKNYNNIFIDSTIVDIITKDFTPLPTIINDNISSLSFIKAQKTDIYCWWDSNPFTTFPICSPIAYIENPNDKNKDKRNGYFKVEGCFCSLNCVKSHLRSKGKQLELLSFYQRKIFGKIKIIKQAPPKEILNCFGGTQTIEEYRESFTSLIDYSLNTFPLVFIPKQVEQRQQTTQLKKSITNIKENKEKFVPRDTTKVNVSRKRITEQIANSNKSTSLSRLLKRN